jgi:hypothetical protein
MARLHQHVPEHNVDFHSGWEFTSDNGIKSRSSSVEKAKTRDGKEMKEHSRVRAASVQGKR